jgi:hypothetical protein
MKPHLPGEIVVFDENIAHSGFNMGKYNRCILILDLKRPKEIPEGISCIDTTENLQKILKYFE